MISAVDGVRHPCGCCGRPARVFLKGHWARCGAHEKRNPCAIEGCTRTRAAPQSGELADHQYLCGTHWRRYVPPKSKRRRAYHAFWRKAQREGWHADLRARYWRFWDQLVKSARSRHDAGAVDIAEINRVMGW